MQLRPTLSPLCLLAVLCFAQGGGGGGGGQLLLQRRSLNPSPSRSRSLRPTPLSPLPAPGVSEASALEPCVRIIGVFLQLAFLSLFYLSLSLSTHPYKCTVVSSWACTRKHKHTQNKKTEKSLKAWRPRTYTHPTQPHLHSRPRQHDHLR
jgi:hypothetical protein